MQKELWIADTGYDPAQDADRENRFLIGNGYLGVRGALEEYRAERLPAVNLAGLYDRRGGGWREPVNAPNPFFLRVHGGEQPLFLPDAQPLAHTQSLDILAGLHRRETVFPLGEGEATLRVERYVHMERVHLLCLRAEISVTQAVSLDITAGIDGEVWDIHGPHFVRQDPGTHGNALTMEAHTNEGERVCVAWRGDLSIDAHGEIATGDGLHVRRWRLDLGPGESVTLHTAAAIFTTKDGPSPLEEAVTCLDALPPWDTLETTHRACWQDLWRKAYVTIQGDEEAERALNYSLYHLLAIAPRHHPSLSVAARGLSGQTYKGAVFWDTEMFMLDFYLAVLPQVARSLIRYRIDTLPGAQGKARSYGLEGAFYAWESQEGGFDACSDYNVTDVFTGRPMRTYFRDKQVHITAAVVHGLLQYTAWTGDETLLLEGGMEVLVEAARFYHSLLVQRVGRTEYALWDVIGPDEYHERVNNNAYTNEMARWVFAQTAQRLVWLRQTHPGRYGALDGWLGREASGLSLADLEAQCLEDAARLVPPTLREGVIEQFDGYFALEDVDLGTLRGRLLHEKEYWGGANGIAAHTQIIKQADVIALLCMRPELATPEVLAASYEYYLPRTEHGSSLSACMYALAACAIGRPQEAYPLFLKSARADLDGGGKQWAGLVYIGGTHPAAAGGAYMVLLRGFLGLLTGSSADEGEAPSFTPRLPAHWRRVQGRITYRGAEYPFDIGLE